MRSGNALLKRSLNFCEEFIYVELICSIAGLALQETPVDEILSASAWSDVLLVQPDYPRCMALTSGASP